MTKPNAPNAEVIKKKPELPAASNTKIGLKKPYTSPRLKVFGTVQAMTQTVGRGGQWDGGHGFRHRTH